MKWPWRKCPEDLAALEESRRRLAEVRKRWPDVQAAAELMDQHREVNGFTAAIRSAMGVRR